MTLFSSGALTQSPATVVGDLTQTGGAPATLVSISDGTVRGSAASGYSDGDGTAARAGQSFEIGSQTKMMTAMVVLQLVEEGQSELDQTLFHYLDDSLIQGIANADSASIGQALDMKTGNANYIDVERVDGTTMFEIIEDNPGEIFDAEEIVALLNAVPASGPVGAQYEYSNTNYFYLSKVIEAVTERSLAEVFQDRIFEPLNMHDSFLNDFRDDADRLSSYLEIDGDVFDVTDVLVDANGEGGAISTTLDMSKFMQALLVDQTLASPAVLASMTDFANGSFDEGSLVFNKDIVRLDIEGIGSFVGFLGGSLGTDSAPYVHLECGWIISVADTQSNLEIDANTGLLYSAVLAGGGPAWMPADIKSCVQLDGISAANLGLATEGGTTTLSAGSAALTLEGRLQDFTSDAFDFSDGSRLLLGAQTDETLKCLRGDQPVWDADNQLRGFGRDDRLHGDSGDDVLWGGRGDDRMIGGNGADVFIFKSASQDGVTDFDIIADFQSGVDKLALHDRSIFDVTQHAGSLELTLDGDGDTILLLGVCDVNDPAFF